MTIREETVARVTPKRIFSIAVHPSNCCSPLVAAGDKWGYVGLWNVVRLSNKRFCYVSSVMSKL